MAIDPTSSTPSPGPARPESAPAASLSSDSLAREYIETELVRSRKVLKQTQIGGGVAVVFVLCYLGYITARFQQSLEPASAAEIAHGIISERLQEQGPAIKERIVAKLPEAIAATPDYALTQMPIYRQALENQINTDLTTYCQASSQQLGDLTDEYLTTNSAQIKQLLANGQDKVLVHQLGAELETEFVKYLQEKPASGESLMDKIDQSLKALQEINAKMTRLATAKDLTPQEIRLRHTIGVVAATSEKAVTVAKNPGTA